MPQTESFNSSEEEAYSSISPSTSELTGSRSSNSRQSGSRLSRLQGGDFNLNPPVDNERFYNINDTNTAASQNSSRRRQHRKPKTQISDSSDSTIFNESETSDEVEKKSKTSSFIETVIENIRGISMIYFFGVSLLIILLTFFLKKDFFWTFYQQKTPHEGETVITFNEISFNCRNIGYSIAFLVFSIGILATLINYGILKIETYFNVKEDYLTILATLSNHLSFIFVLSILLIILVYEGYLNLQFAKDTALDCGHVINTLLFSTILLAIKSYFLKSVSLSFDHERYLKRVRGIIRDTYFLKLLKAIKRVRKKEQNGEIIMTVPVNDSVIGGNEFDQESFEGTFNNE
ncbi:Small Conductance Mechanosensitive Ion Channel (MscS) Family, partial [Pseudoloma neurophilia]